MIGERTTSAAVGHRAQAQRRPKRPVETPAAQRGNASSDQIRAIIASLELREQEDLEQSRQARIRTIGEARRDLVHHGGRDIAAGHVALPRGAPAEVVPAGHPGRQRRSSEVRSPWPRKQSPDAKDAAVGTLLRDALLRARLAVAEAPADSSRRERLGSLVAAMEQALSAHAGAYAGDRAQPERARCRPGDGAPGARLLAPGRTDGKGDDRSIGDDDRCPQGVSRLPLGRVGAGSDHSAQANRRRHVGARRRRRSRFPSHPCADRQSRIAGHADAEGKRGGDRAAGGHHGARGHRTSPEKAPPGSPSRSPFRPETDREPAYAWARSDRPATESLPDGAVGVPRHDYRRELVFSLEAARPTSAASRSPCALCAVARSRMSGGSTAMP